MRRSGFTVTDGRDGPRVGRSGRAAAWGLVFLFSVGCSSSAPDVDATKGDVAAHTDGGAVAQDGASSTDVDTDALQSDTSKTQDTDEVVDAVVCSPDCGLKVCGDDGCGGVCGTCGEPTVCSVDATMCVCPEVGYQPPECSWCADGYGAPNCDVFGYKEVAVGDPFSGAIRTDGRAVLQLMEQLSNLPPGYIFYELYVGEGPYHGVVATGDYHCFLDTENNAYCVKYGEYAVLVPPQPGKFSQLAAGASFACGVQLDGSLGCWWFDGEPELGTWQNQGQANPPEGVGFVQVCAAWTHACALRDDGSVLCWGENGKGEATPPVGVELSSLECATFVNCGLTANGALVCWGDDMLTTPPPGDGFLDVACGSSHCCVLDKEGVVTCWGTSPDNPPDLPPEHAFVSLSGVSYTFCGVRANGSVHCWGGQEVDMIPLPGAP